MYLATLTGLAAEEFAERGRIEFLPRIDTMAGFFSDAQAA
jgi:hypothetical protein